MHLTRFALVAAPSDHYFDLEARKTLGCEVVVVVVRVAGHPMHRLELIARRLQLAESLFHLWEHLYSRLSVRNMDRARAFVVYFDRASDLEMQVAVRSADSICHIDHHHDYHSDCLFVQVQVVSAVV